MTRLPAAFGITSRRLLQQQLLRPQHRAPADLVRWMGAVQAQDYAGSLWAVGLRLAESVTEAAVEEAIAARAIVRTWPMRGTLHFVPAEDARWMVGLLAPRMIARAAGRHRQLGLDDSVFNRSRRILTRALRDGGRLTRPEAYATLERGGVSTEGQRGIHILGHLAQQAFLCFGPRAGRQPTFVLFEEWVRESKAPPSEEALATLAARYFASHGPATRQDFAWWTGLPVKEAEAAIAAAGARLTRDGDGRILSTSVRRAAGASRPSALLLPPWDEYVVAYRDRTAVMDERRAREEALATIGRPLVVIDGRVCGAWRRTLGESTVRVELELWSKLRRTERDALEEAASRYGRFLGREARIGTGGY